MTRMFTFDPHELAPKLAAQDYVHIPQGLSEEFFQRVCQQIDAFLEANRLQQFALGNKQQALYEFPTDADFYDQFVETLAALGGLDPAGLVISERHIKAYEPNAAPDPMPHKDRFATQFAVGFTVRNPKGSQLVIYPDADRGINPFNSWAELRASLPPEKLPPEVLKNARRVVFHDQPRDVIVFRGNEIWHTRENGADTVMLYFKINAFHCDPIGEDPRTPDFQQQTQQRAALAESQLEALVPVLGRRVDYIQRRYNCQWQEVIGVVLSGQPHFTIDEQEWQLLRAMDGQRSLLAILSTVAAGNRQELLNKVRRLVQRGIVDLLSPAQEQVPGANGATSRESALVLAS